MDKKLNLGILTFPIEKNGITPLSNLVEILFKMSNDLHLITGNAGYDYFKKDKRIFTHNINHKKQSNVISRVLRYIKTQINISITLSQKNVDIWFFFIGCENLLFPLLVAKLLQKKVIFVLAGFPLVKTRSDNYLVFFMSILLTRINFYLSNKIIVYADRIIEERNLYQFKDKIIVAPRHFLNFNNYKIKKDFCKRKNIIGFIGTLDEIKGVLNYINSIPLILDEKEDIEFWIIGDGKLKSVIEKYRNKNLLNEKLKLIGWIPHEDLPNYLNELKLLVIPSYTEGLPNVMLEAMACGTPVLATSVGAIPEIIKNEKTGFIMENNSPKCIKKNILKSLNSPKTEHIVYNSHFLVKNRFNYENVMKVWDKIINDE